MKHKLKPWEVMKAFEEGAKIERSINCGLTWEETDLFPGDWTHYNYRVKSSVLRCPLTPGPQYLGRAVTRKNNRHVALLIAASPATEEFLAGGLWVTSERLRADWTFADGTPCEEEEIT